MADEILAHTAGLCQRGSAETLWIHRVLSRIKLSLSRNSRFQLYLCAETIRLPPSRVKFRST